MKMTEHDCVSYPHTFRSPSAQAVYEQCVWDREHVLAIYPILSGALAADGEWHEIPTSTGAIGRYRVFEERYFQAVFAAESTPVFRALASMEAVETQDDA